MISDYKEYPVRGGWDITYKGRTRFLSITDNNMLHRKYTNASNHRQNIIDYLFKTKYTNKRIGKV